MVLGEFWRGISGVLQYLRVLQRVSETFKEFQRDSNNFHMILNGFRMFLDSFVISRQICIISRQLAADYWMINV